MKKITFCITNDYTYDRRIQRCAEALSPFYKIEIICRALHKDEPISEKVSVRRMKLWVNTGFLFYAVYNINLFFKLISRKTDLVVAVDYDSLMGAYFGSKIYKTPLILDAHEYFEESIEIVNRKRVQKFWKWIGNTFVPKVQLAYTVSHTIAKLYSDQHKIHFKTIRNVPYYHHLGSIKVKPEKVIILYQGVINQGRKLELLVDTAQYLPDHFEIWIIGEGDLSDELRSRANDKVVFHSWVHPEKLYELTEQAVLAYNLLDDSSKSYYYSLANKFFDYIQAGVPSINSPFPEYLSLNERYNCCFTTDIDTAEELALLIIDLVKDKSLLAEKVKNARLAALDLSWEKESKKLLKIFKNL